MFGIGSTELLVILVVALIVLGPKSLASISRTLGKAMGEFRRVSTDFQRTLNAEVAQEEDEERRKKAAEKPPKQRPRLKRPRPPGRSALRPAKERRRKKRLPRKPPARKPRRFRLKQRLPPRPRQPRLRKLLKPAPPST